MLFRSRGIEPDAERGAKLILQAAQQGDVSAQSQMGELYAAGRGVAQDWDEAWRWFFFASTQGDGYAYFSLGVMYQQGLGVEKDAAEAADDYRHAMEHGEWRAGVNLGYLYAQGDGGSKNLVEAYMWFTVAAARAPSAEDSASAKKNRDEIAARMTSEQIAEAEKLASAWKPASS